MRTWIVIRSLEVEFERITNRLSKYPNEKGTDS
jgi:hypothetical protein